LGVSYSLEGLKYTQDSTGKLIFFENAHIDYTNKDKITIRGNMKQSRNIRVQKYIPTNQKNSKHQMVEFSMMNKAYRLIYNTNSILD